MTPLNVPYLGTTRDFQEDLHLMSIEMNRAYIDIAGAVNTRTIGIFPLNKNVLTGDTYYLVGSQKQQILRKLFSFKTTADILHGIDFTAIFGFARGYGAFTDGTNWYGLIFGSNQLIPGQRSFYIDPKNIKFLAGAGAPALTQGTLVVEWISNV